MATKLAKDTLAAGHSENDFEAFGPVATKDGEFSNTKIADLGCFNQEACDTNKAYVAAVVKSKINGKYYTYFTWGRTGNSLWQFQMTECASENEAQQLYEKQCHSKNDKRGIWADVCGVKTLKAKPNSDVYLVRSLATRSVGLPEMRKITNTVKVISAGKAGVVAKQSKYDDRSHSLISDLLGGTVSYARSSMADANIPSMEAIGLARQLLLEAQKLLLLPAQNSPDLKEITYQLYSRIPKRKSRGASESSWLLNANNIFEWGQELDAYESALGAQTFESEQSNFDDLPFGVSYIDPKSEFGRFMYDWWPHATRRVHSYLDKMKIANMWEISKDDTIFKKNRQTIVASKITEKPNFQDKIKKSEADKKSHTNWLFHGTRSVNLLSILKEGLRLPRTLSGVAITGALFGPGVYWADDWGKSAGYTSLGNSYWSRGSGTINNRKAFMFTGEVILGNIHVAPYGYSHSNPPSGFHSCMGKAGASGVQNNEYIVYNTDQCKLRYLVEFEA